MSLYFWSHFRIFPQALVTFCCQRASFFRSYLACAVNRDAVGVETLMAQLENESNGGDSDELPVIL